MAAINKKEIQKLLTESAYVLHSLPATDNPLLVEATRQDLINQSKKGRPTKTYKTTRYARRTKSSVNPSVKTYNQIDMNALFKGGLLSFKVPVHGETNDYEVELLFDHFLEELQKEVKDNNYKCEYKTVAKALMRAYNRDDTYIACSCPDFQYRFNYWATHNKYNAGKPELRVADITNPDNDLGAACKHSLLVLSNLKWAIKVASVINNYINYMAKHEERLYADVIFPAVYGMPYKKAIQLGLFDDEAELDNTMDNPDTSNIDKINKVQGDSGKYRKGGVGEINNQQPAYQKKGPENMQLDLDVEEET